METSEDIFDSFITEHFIYNNETLLNASTIFKFRSMQPIEKQRFEERVVGALSAELILKYLKSSRSTLDVLKLRIILANNLALWKCSTPTIELILNGIDSFISSREDCTHAIINSLLQQNSSISTLDLTMALIRANGNRTDLVSQRLSHHFSDRLISKRYPFDCSSEHDLLLQLRNTRQPIDKDTSLSVNSSLMFDPDGLTIVDAIIEDVKKAKDIYNLMHSCGLSQQTPSIFYNNKYETFPVSTRISAPIPATEFFRSLDVMKSLQVSLLPTSEHFWPPSYTSEGPLDVEEKAVLLNPEGCVPECFFDELRQAVIAANIVFSGLVCDRMLWFRFDLGSVKIEIEGLGELEGTPAQVAVLGLFEGNEAKVKKTLEELMAELNVWDDEIVRGWLDYWIRLGVLKKNGNNEYEEVDFSTNSKNDGYSPQHDTTLLKKWNNDLIVSHFTFPENKAFPAVRAVLQIHPDCDIRRLHGFLRRYMIDPPWDWDRARLQKLLTTMIEKRMLRSQNGIYNVNL